MLATPPPPSGGESSGDGDAGDFFCRTGAPHLELPEQVLGFGQNVVSWEFVAVTHEIFNNEGLEVVVEFDVKHVGIDATTANLQPFMTAQLQRIDDLDGLGAVGGAGGSDGASTMAPPRTLLTSSSPFVDSHLEHSSLQLSDAGRWQLTVVRMAGAPESLLTSIAPNLRVQRNCADAGWEFNVP